MKELRLRSNYLKFSLSIILILIASNFVCSQELSIIVEDQSGLALPGVEVFTDDFKFTTVSDLEGKLTLTDLPSEIFINFKFLGYESKRVQFQELKNLENSLLILYEQEILLNEITVIGRSDGSKETIPYEVALIDSKEIAFSNAQTSADALVKNADVYVQKSQMGGGSPIIRGFEANKVLLVVDGVRLNNAIYRSGHLQSSITVDNNMLDRMEVIYGPGSLMYGSDALGGVVHFRTKEPLLSPTGKMRTEGNYYGRFSSANVEKTGHVDLSLGFDKWASLTSVTFTDYDNLRMGSVRTPAYPDFGKRFIYTDISEEGIDEIAENPSENIQVGTAYSQFDFLQKFKFQPNSNFKSIINFQYSKSSNIPRYDALTEPAGSGLTYSEWYYGPQNRFLGSAKFDYKYNNLLFDQIIGIYAFQAITESRHTRLFGDPILTNGTEDIVINSITLDFNKSLGNRFGRIDYGLDVANNQLQSEAFNLNVVTDEIDELVFTRYPSDNSSLNSIGGYMQHTYLNRDSSVQVNSGIRYSATQIFVQFLESDPIEWPSEFYDGLTSTNDAFTWSLGSTFRLNRNLTLRPLISTAFRSPNIDDLAKTRVKGDEVSIPNKGLQPEYSYNGEIGLNFQKPQQFHINATYFYTYLENAIVRENFQLENGDEFIIRSGDSLRVVANVNSDQARIFGFSLNGGVQINKTLKLASSVTYVQGQSFDSLGNAEPLGHIPPIYGRSSLSYQKEKLRVVLSSTYNALKPIDRYGGSVDNPEFATAIGALGWYTIDLNSNWNISEKYSLGFAIENILDKHYRTFASGVSAPGINFIVSFKGKF